MNIKTKNIALLISYLFVVVTVSFHHHSADELLPPDLIDNSGNGRSGYTINASECPVVQFAGNGFSAEFNSSNFQPVFDNVVLTLIPNQHLLPNPISINISLRAPPIV